MEKAEQLIKKANRLERRKSNVFRSLFGYNNNTKHAEEAAELYTKAGNCLKIHKHPRTAVEAYKKAFILFTKCNDTQNATKCLEMAAKCIEDTDVNECIRIYKNLVQLYESLEEMRKVAETFIILGGLHFEINIQETIDFYTKACDIWRKIDSDGMEFIDAMENLADVYIQNTMYGQSIDIYRQLLDNDKVDKSKKGEYYIILRILALLNDDVNMIHKIKETYQTANRFIVKFVDELVDAYESNNIDIMDKCINEYDSITRLNTRLFKIVSKLKNHISEQ